MSSSQEAHSSFDISSHSAMDPDTVSLDASFETTVQIHGRIYQQWALEHGTSWSPIDEYERERQIAQHEIFRLLFERKLIFPPVNNPRRILDCGYGSGSWATEVALKHPECEVIGIDITPHMRPDEPQPNLLLQVDDLNEPFTFQTNEFDFVHSRNVVTGINKGRWKSYVSDCARVLKPGGWLQMVEIYHNVQSDNGTMTDEHALRQMSAMLFQASDPTKNLRAPQILEHLMRQAGLVDLASRMMRLPLNGWSSDPKEREIGERFNQSYKAALVGYTQIPFTTKLGLSNEEFEDLMRRVREDVDNVNLKPYVGLYISIGRKSTSA